jgi:hypothetical protein
VENSHKSIQNTATKESEYTIILKKKTSDKKKTKGKKTGEVESL